MKFCLRQQLFAFKEFCIETRLSNIYKTTNVTNFTKAILKSSYRVLQVTSKWKTLKQPVYFWKAVEFFSTFDIQIDKLWLYFGKSCKTRLFRKPAEVKAGRRTCYFLIFAFSLFRSLSKHVNIHINRATHYEITTPQKHEKFVFFWRFFFQNENCWNFEFSMNQIFGQRFIIFKKLRYRDLLLLKLWVVEVLKAALKRNVC